MNSVYFEGLSPYVTPLIIREQYSYVTRALKDKIGKYMYFGVGMGCVLYTRNSLSTRYSSRPIQYLFLSDDEEQDPNRSPLIKEFISGYTYYDPNRDYVEPVVPFKGLLQ
jgi:hypothetical protein